jgi:hypothetical protein
MITGVELGEHVPFHDGRDYPRSFDRIVSSL